MAKQTKDNLFLLVIAGFLLACVAIASAHTTHPPNDGIRCTDDAHCPADMCCVHNPLTKPGHKRRRFIFSEYEQHDHGYCRRARRFNETCWPFGHNAVNHDLYEFFCPCESGLECRGLVVHESQNQIIHEHPVCQDPETNLIDTVSHSGQICTDDVDCPAGQCCVQHPLSDKRRQQGQHGYCRDEKRLNETCTMIVGDFPTHDFQCPCEAGLECRGKVVHHFDNGTAHVHENPICQKPSQR